MIRASLARVTSFALGAATRQAAPATALRFAALLGARDAPVPANLNAASMAKPMETIRPPEQPAARVAIEPEPVVKASFAAAAPDPVRPMSLPSGPVRQDGGSTTSGTARRRAPATPKPANQPSVAVPSAIEARRQPEPTPPPAAPQVRSEPAPAPAPRSEAASIAPASARAQTQATSRDNGMALPPGPGPAVVATRASEPSVASRSAEPPKSGFVEPGPNTVQSEASPPVQTAQRDVAGSVDHPAAQTSARAEPPHVSVSGEAAIGRSATVSALPSPAADNSRHPTSPNVPVSQAGAAGAPTPAAPPAIAAHATSSFVASERADDVSRSVATNVAPLANADSVRHPALPGAGVPLATRQLFSAPLPRGAVDATKPIPFDRPVLADVEPATPSFAGPWTANTGTRSPLAGPAAPAVSQQAANAPKPISSLSHALPEARAAVVASSPNIVTTSGSQTPTDRRVTTELGSLAESGSAADGSRSVVSAAVQPPAVYVARQPTSSGPDLPSETIVASLPQGTDTKKQTPVNRGVAADVVHAAPVMTVQSRPSTVVVATPTGSPPPTYDDPPGIGAILAQTAESAKPSSESQLVPTSAASTHLSAKAAGPILSEVARDTGFRVSPGEVAIASTARGPAISSHVAIRADAAPAPMPAMLRPVLLGDTATISEADPAALAPAEMSAPIATARVDSGRTETPRPASIAAPIATVSPSENRSAEPVAARVEAAVVQTSPTARELAFAPSASQLDQAVAPASVSTPDLPIVDQESPQSVREAASDTRPVESTAPREATSLNPAPIVAATASTRVLPSVGPGPASTVPTPDPARRSMTETGSATSQSHAAKSPTVTMAAQRAVSVAPPQAEIAVSDRQDVSVEIGNAPTFATQPEQRWAGTVAASDPAEHGQAAAAQIAPARTDGEARSVPKPAAQGPAKAAIAIQAAAIALSSDDVAAIAPLPVDAAVTPTLTESQPAAATPAQTATKASASARVVSTHAAAEPAPASATQDPSATARVAAPAELPALPAAPAQPDAAPDGGATFSTMAASTATAPLAASLTPTSAIADDQVAPAASTEKQASPAARTATGRIADASAIAPTQEQSATARFATATELLAAFVVPVQPGAALDRAAASLSIAAPAANADPVTRQLDLAQGTAWLDQLASDIAASAGGGASATPMRFSLSPAQLGPLTVELSGVADAATLRLVTETREAHRILTEAQPQLVAEARAQGLRITETQIDLGSSAHGGGQLADQSARDDARRQLAAQAPVRPSTRATSTPSPRADRDRSAASDLYA